MLMMINQDRNDIELPSFIDRPDLQSYGQRTVSSVLAVVGWTCWLYLILPLLTLIAWIGGYHRVNQYVVLNKDGFLEQINILGPVVLILVVLLLVWATYNLIRFRDVARRNAPQNTTVGEMAEHFHVDEKLITRAQEHQVVIFYFDEHGAITNIVDSERLTTLVDD
jgi:biofilm PGA synthesis protein PgaD